MHVFYNSFYFFALLSKPTARNHGQTLRFGQERAHHDREFFFVVNAVRGNLVPRWLASILQDQLSEKEKTQKSYNTQETIYS